jgi:hypothetical protein
VVPKLELRLALPEAELLDASDDLQRLLEQEEHEWLGPASRHLLLALNDAITDAFETEANRTTASAAAVRRYGIA